MKQVILIALALACVCATPHVQAFEFDAGQWITTFINRIILQIVLPFYAIFGVLFALFGQPLWFATNAWTLVSDSFKLPAKGVSVDASYLY